MLKIIELIKRIFRKAGNIFYVGATDILPEPLSKEKEDFYLSLLEDGDMKARDILIEHNLRLVVFLAKKYENFCLKSNISSIDDIVSRRCFSFPSTNNPTQIVELPISTAIIVLFML